MHQGTQKLVQYTFVSLFLFTLSSLPLSFAPPSHPSLSVSPCFPFGAPRLAVLSKMDVCIPEADGPVVTVCTRLTLRHPAACLTDHCLGKGRSFDTTLQMRVVQLTNHMGTHTFVHTNINEQTVCQIHRWRLSY